jgi:hypothetical protein
MPIGNVDAKRLEGPLPQEFNQVFLSHDFARPELVWPHSIVLVRND